MWTCLTAPNSLLAVVRNDADVPWPRRRQVLRLLPISGGRFAGPFKGNIPTITAKALKEGYLQLSPTQKAKLMHIEVDMCIFEQSEFKQFEEDFADVKEVKVHVKPYSVLGTQKNIRTSSIKEPDPRYDTIVDPAGLPFIERSGPRYAGFASKAIYEHIRIDKNASFPEGVQGQITQETQAVAYAYPMPGEAKQRVVHVVGPDFTSQDAAKEERDAIDQLAKAYQNVFTAYVNLAA